MLDRQMNMPLNSIKSLDQIIVNSPCPMNWDLMNGDDQKRFCDRCQKNVYNISSMSNQEALNVIRSTETEMCVRFFRRPDGTIVTGECPPLQSTKNGRRRFQFSIASLLVLLTASAGLCASAPWIGKKVEPLINRWFPKPNPTQTAPPQSMIVGELMVMPESDSDTSDAPEAMMGGVGLSPATTVPNANQLIPDSKDQ